MNRHCIRLSIVTLAAAAFGLVPVAGPAQALAESGNNVSSTISVTASGGSSATVSATLSPNDSTWD